MNEVIQKLILEIKNIHKKEQSFAHIPSLSSSNQEQINDIITTNKTLFFSASHSRVILITWLCKSIRNLYEKYEYSDIDIGIEAYEILRKDFKTKALNRIELLKLFPCNKNILSYPEFIKYEKKYIEIYNTQVEPLYQLSIITHIHVIKPQPVIDISEEIKDLLKNNRDFSIILDRSKGKTLDEIGLHHNITRERTRQLENRPKLLIERWFELRKKELLDKYGTQGYIETNSLHNNFKEDIISVFKYVIGKNDNPQSNWFYIKELDIFVYDQNKLIQNKLIEISNQLKGSTENNIILEFTKKMQGYGYEFLTAELLEKYLKNLGFLLVNNKIYTSKLTIGNAIIHAMDIRFKNGIDIKNQKELHDLADFIETKYNLETTDGRALTTRIQDVLIMCDKTKYCSLKNLNYQESIKKVISNFIEFMPDDKVTYQTLYKKIQSELQEQTNLNNAYFLHGFIKQFETELNVESTRYYVCKKKKSSQKPAAFFEKLNSFLLEKKTSVTIDSILEFLPDWNERYVKYAMLYFPKIVKWSKNEYINLDVIQLTPEEKKELDLILKKLMQNALLFTTSHKIYSYLKEQQSNILKNYKITSPEQIYHIIAYYYQNEYQYYRPYIIDKNSIFNEKNKLSAEKLVSVLIPTNTQISKKDLIEKCVGYYGKKNSSLDLAISNYIKANPQNIKLLL